MRRKSQYAVRASTPDASNAEFSDNDPYLKRRAKGSLPGLIPASWGKYSSPKRRATATSAVQLGGKVAMGSPNSPGVLLCDA